MEFGAGLPNDMLNDMVAIRDWVQAIDEAGFDYLSLSDHVLGTPRGNRIAVVNAAVVVSDSVGKFQGIYTDETVVHEPLIMSAYVLALTKRLKCVTSILILPQRQAVVVAKQAAELAVVSDERFVLGVGVGYQPWEFEALDMQYETRGPRFEEQIIVMRELWANHLITFEGKFHTLHNVGLNPRPPSGRVPLWMGGGAAADPVGVQAPPTRTLKRIGRLGDGWNIAADNFQDFVVRRDIMRDAAREAGRDPLSIGISRGVRIDPNRDLLHQVAYAKRWEAAGVTHSGLQVSAETAKTPDERLKRMIEFREAFNNFKE